MKKKNKQIIKKANKKTTKQTTKQFKKIKHFNKKHSKIIFNKRNILFSYFYSKKIKLVRN